MCGEYNGGVWVSAAVRGRMVTEGERVAPWIAAWGLDIMGI